MSTTYTARWRFVLALLLVTVPDRVVYAADKAPLLVVGTPPGKSALTGVLAELGRSNRYRLLLLPALLPLMREADDRANVNERAFTLIEQGRELLVALNHENAKIKLQAGLEVLEQGFVRYYEPRVLANVRLLLGQWALERTRPDLAEHEFQEALALDPALSLDAHFSPQVRAAFNALKQRSPGRSTYSSGELRKLLRLADSPAAVVLGVEAAGDRALVRGAVFAGTRGAYATVESLLVDPAKPEALVKDASTLGARLRNVADSLFPAPPLPPVARSSSSRPTSHQPTPQLSRPWYRRWYTWVTAGVVVAGTIAVVLPFALRHEVVEGTARW